MYGYIVWDSGIIKCTFPCFNLVENTRKRNATTAVFIQMSFQFDLFPKVLSQLPLSLLNKVIVSVTSTNEDLTFGLVESELEEDWGV